MSSISFISTVFNKSSYLANMLKSLSLQQGNFTKEYIFIDDGSTDNSLSILKELTADWQNVTIISQPNSGPSIGVNKAIKAARGEFCQFIDADDILTNNSTNLLLQALNSSDADCAFGKLGRYDPANPCFDNFIENTKSAVLIENSIREVIRGKIKGISSIGATRSMARTKALIECTGSDERVFVQDLSLSLHAAATNNFVYLDQKIAAIPIIYNSDHLSSHSFQEEYDTLLALYYFIIDYPDLARMNSKWLFRRLRSVMWKFYKRDYELSVNFFKKFFNYLKSKIFIIRSPQELLILYNQELAFFEQEINFPRIKTTALNTRGNKLS